MNATLQQRIQRLEDLEAIRDLTARYADAINKGWNGKTVDLDAVAQVFTTDASWESHEGEVTVGMWTVDIVSAPAGIEQCRFSSISCRDDYPLGQEQSISLAEIRECVVGQWFT